MFKIPTNEEMVKILDAGLEDDYPDDSVEMGEGWELIAAVFFKAGYEAAKEGA